ncbi:MAG: phosphopentomutase [Bacilli bacterium]|nr:phosphopentomutase [Bacilli bacterium]
MFKRVFLVVLDSVGIGEAPDAEKYDDVGANTFLHTIGDAYNLDVLERLGMTELVGKHVENTRGLYMRAKPINLAKDTLNGHYEMMGAVQKTPYKTYPNGFPLELISKIQQATGREVIGNIAASGTQIIEELGEMHMKTGAIIVYTSADSVLQIAAHEDVIPVEELYKICETVRELTKGDEYKIARIIARPFIGRPGAFTRTPKRHDYALDPPLNVLDLLDRNGIETIAIGKISDIFNNKSISVKIKTKDNIDGMMKLIDFAKGEFKGLLFANLNDFDMLYGHRRDRVGYLKALEEFNYYLPILLKNLKNDDLLIITADHGNDPTYKGTDHTREMVPILIYSPIFKKGKHLDDRSTFADIGATILDNFGIENTIGIGESIFNEFKKE